MNELAGHFLFARYFFLIGLSAEKTAPSFYSSSSSYVVILIFRSGLIFKTSWFNIVFFPPFISTLISSRPRQKMPPCSAAGPALAPATSRWGSSSSSCLPRR